MLTNTQCKAVGMLFEFTDGEAARQLRVKKETIEAWMQEPEFQQALRNRLMENRRTAARILSRLYVEASKELEALIRSNDDKNKPRAIIEVLKVGGLFKELGMEEGDGIGNLIEKLSEERDDEEL